MGGVRGVPHVSGWANPHRYCQTARHRHTVAVMPRYIQEPVTQEQAHRTTRAFTRDEIARVPMLRALDSLAAAQAPYAELEARTAQDQIPRAAEGATRRRTLGGALQRTNARGLAPPHRPRRVGNPYF